MQLGILRSFKCAIRSHEFEERENRLEYCKHCGAPNIYYNLAVLKVQMEKQYVQWQEIRFKRLVKEAIEEMED